MTLMRPRLFSEVPSLRDAIDRLFDESFVSPRQTFPMDRFDRPAIDAYSTPEAFVAMIKDEMEGWGRVAKAANIKPE